jgi:hypothetical protein
VSFHQQGWVVVAGNGALKWEGLELPPGANKFLQGAVDAGAQVLSVSYTQRGWAIVTNRAVEFGGVVPSDLVGFINNLRQNRVGIRSISLAPNDAWVVVYK